MISRRTLVAGIGTAVLLAPGAAFAGNEQRFTAQAFRAAQDAGKPILIEIHASWCPTCKAQIPILSELTAQPKFKDMVVLRVDFDSQKDEVRNFGARVQSTLIVFKGATEVGRSVGDTNRNTIAALLDKAI
jgi:thioredoxin 1